MLTVVHTGLVASGASEYAAVWQSHLLGLQAHLANQEPGNWWQSFAALRSAYAAMMQ